MTKIAKHSAIFQGKGAGGGFIAGGSRFTAGFGG